LRIRGRVRADAVRSAALSVARSVLGPLYDPDKEDQYVLMFMVHMERRDSIQKFQKN